MTLNCTLYYIKSSHSNFEVIVNGPSCICEKSFNMEILNFYNHLNDEYNCDDQVCVYK